MNAGAFPFQGSGPASGLTGGDEDDPRLSAPATERNRAAILEVLSRVLPASGTILELASGTGEHAAWFARHLDAVDWQPSDPDPRLRRSIDAHARDAADAGLRAPAPALDIDVTRRPWPVADAAAAVCINMIHISPWAATTGLFAGCRDVLRDGAPLVLYGPFKRGGAHTADSNAHFDDSLRARDPRWGVRDVDDVAAVARDHDFGLEEIVEMPANNLCLVFRREGSG